MTSPIITLTHCPHCDVCGKDLSDEAITIYRILDACPMCYDNVNPLIGDIADILSIPKDGEKDRRIEILDTYSDEMRMHFMNIGITILQTDTDLFQKFMNATNCSVLQSALLMLLLYNGMSSELAL